jgi:hypothetical protein
MLLIEQTIDAATANANIVITNHQASVMMKYANELCLTPVSRIKVLREARSPIWGTQMVALEDVGRYACATASPQGWDISVAPLLVPASRSTTLGQANFIG